MGHLNDRQIDEILSGRSPLREGSFAEIARHLADARSQLVQAPDEATQKAHLAAIVKTARESSGQTWSAPTTHRRPSPLVRLRVAAMRVGAGAVAASLSTMGLAYAGVDLPGTAAERAFERVGIHLPNQTPEGSGKSVAGDVREVIENADERNCDFGRAVSEAASQNRQSEDKAKEDNCRDRSENTRSKGDGGKARAEDRSDGNAKANEAPRGRKNGKNDKKDAKKNKTKKNAGEARGDERRNDKANPEPNRGGNAPDRSSPDQSDGSGKGNGGDASGAGKERADEARARNSAGDVVDAVVPDEISEKTKGAGKQK